MVQFYLEFTGDFGGGGPLSFFASQMGEINYLNIPIFILGLYFYLRSDAGRELRALGLTYIILYIFMTVVDFKPYYLAPVYPMLFAGGAMLIEKKLDLKERDSPVVRLEAVCCLPGDRRDPVRTPPDAHPPSFDRRQCIWRIHHRSGQRRRGQRRNGPPPSKSRRQTRLGHDGVDPGAGVRHSPSQRKKPGLHIHVQLRRGKRVNFLGKGLGLPEAISGHNSYFIWGPDSCTGQVLITVGFHSIAHARLLRT